MINDIKELRGRQPNSFVDPFFFEGQTEEEYAEMMDEIVTCEYGEESMIYRNLLRQRQEASHTKISTIFNIFRARLSKRKGL